MLSKEGFRMPNSDSYRVTERVLDGGDEYQEIVLGGAIEFFSFF